MKKRAVKEGKQYARFAAYAAAVGATLASAGTAEAGIQYTSLNGNLAASSSGAAVDKFLAYAKTSSFNVFVKKWGYIAGTTAAKINSVGGLAALLGTNQTVGPSSGRGFGERLYLFLVQRKNGAVTNSGGNFPTTSTGGYLGIRFGLNSDANKYYGWMHIAQVDRTVPSFSIDGWAYETTADLAIKAGATVTVPEPTSCALALIALGAGGLAVHRRRRQERDALTDLAE